MLILDEMEFDNLLTTWCLLVILSTRYTNKIELIRFYLSTICGRKVMTLSTHDGEMDALVMPTKSWSNGENGERYSLRGTG